MFLESWIFCCKSGIYGISGSYNNCEMFFLLSFKGDLSCLNLIIG